MVLSTMFFKENRRHGLESSEISLKKYNGSWKKNEFLRENGQVAFNSGRKNISDKVDTISYGVELFPQMEGSRISNSGVVGNDAGR